MKLNLKKILSSALTVLMCSCCLLKSSAAEFIKYPNSTRAITLNSVELESLSYVGHSITTIDNQYVITSIGCPKNVNVPALPECNLFQIDFMRSVPVSPKLDRYNGITFMNVTLGGKLLRSYSLVRSWACISVYNVKKGTSKLFKVCA